MPRSPSIEKHFGDVPPWRSDPFLSMELFRLGTHPVLLSMRRLVESITPEIPYAIAGGLAVQVHGVERPTDNVDILLRAESLTTVRELLLQANFINVPNKSRRFIDGTDQILLRIVLAGHYPGISGPKPIAFPDPLKAREAIGGVYYLKLRSLLELKLVSVRFQDLADAVALARANNLDGAFARCLDPSCRAEFHRCLEEIRGDEAFNND